LSSNVDVLKLELQPFVKRSFTTALGLATTLVDASLTEPNDFWNGMAILIRTGACAGQLRRVLDYDLGTSTLTVNVAFSAPIAAGVQYVMFFPTILQNTDLYDRLKTVWGWDELPVTERWEWLDAAVPVADQLDIMKIRYSGRTGAWWASECRTPHSSWTMPLVALNKYPALAPWSHAIHLRNSKDGVTVDEIYLGMRLKKGLKKGCMRITIEVPAVATLPPGTLIAAGFEVNSQGGSAAVWVGWLSGVMSMHIIPLTQNGLFDGSARNIVQFLPGAPHTLYLDWNPPVFRLTQGNNLAIDELINPNLTNIYSIQPFVCNESTAIVDNVFLGDSWAVWETDDQSVVHNSTPFHNPVANPSISLDVGNRRCIEIFVQSIAGGQTVNLYGSYDRVNWRLCDTFTTDAVTTLLHKGRLNAYRFIRLELIETGAGDSLLEITANGGA